MARIAGITLPPDKRIEIGLTYIYGIGRSKSKAILEEAKIDMDKKVKALAETQVGRFATPEDVAHVVAFLCSDLARHITGEVIKVDGGQYI